MTDGVEALRGDRVPTLILDLTVYTPQTLDAQAELFMARAIAAAANTSSSNTLQQEDIVTIGFALASNDDKAASSLLPMRWSRAEIDQLSRALDRAVSRIHPALDPLQYLSATSPRFTHTTKETNTPAASQLLFVLEVCPSVRFWRGLPCLSSKSDAANIDINIKGGALREVEGALVESLAQLASLPDVPVFINNTEQDDSNIHAEKRIHESVSVNEGSTANDASLWRRARAARAAHRLQHETLQDARVGIKSGRVDEADRDGDADSQFGSNSNGSSVAIQEDEDEDDEAAKEKALRTRSVRLARWLAERLVNEASWARPSSSSSSAMHVHRGKIRHTPSTQRHGTPHYGSVLEAAVTSPTADTMKARRYVHADGCGIELNAMVIGYTTRYAYLAVPTTNSFMPAMQTHGNTVTSKGTTDAWYLVCRVPHPAQLTSAMKAVTSSHKRTREVTEQQEEEDMKVQLHNRAEAMRHDNSSSFVLLSAAARMHVTVRAYRVYCQGTGQRRAHNFLTPPSALPSCNTIALWFDDVYVISTHNNIHDECCSFDDCVTLVQRSCARYLTRYTKYQSVLPRATRHTSPSNNKEEGVSSEKYDGPRREMYARAARLYDAMTDTVSVHFGKPRGRTASKAHTHSFTTSKSDMPVPVVQTCRDIAGLNEGCTVEFKYKLGGNEANNNNSDTATTMIIMSVERIRHTIAAMASMYGGVILVGVTDEASVVGHSAGLVLSQLRATGFCPAMVKDSVTVKELRVLQTHKIRQSEQCEEASTTSNSNAARMPANWWKQAAHTDTTSKSALHDSSSSADKVVTVVTVQRGQAPFYTSARHTLPYLRGCASTTPMPMAVMTMRIAHALYLE